ncbi:uncharacterized protein [Miscanthus floridulus]|uniref:uncharacterized protein n=1 Tax=Miscanthus floridulus TaxID=154761 RepID=UPI003457D58C
MDSKVCCVFQLALLLGVVLALAGPIIAGGSVEVGLASKAAGAGAYAVRQMMMAQVTTTAKSTMGLEVHRLVLGSLSPNSLDRNKPACPVACPAAGMPYTGRDCHKVYRCSG